MLFHEVVARNLADHGVKTVFGVLGDANLYMMDSYQRLTDGTYCSVSNEAAAVLAANGYARTSGKLGVATVTHGPALTNTVTALVESVRDHTPVLLVAGDTAVVDQHNLQNITQRDIALAADAGFVQVRAPQTVADDIAEAIGRAHLERRPIVLNVPVDFMWQEAKYHSPAPRFVAPQAVAPDPVALDAAVGVIAAARRPVVLAGRGAASPQARAALLRLAERIGAPVATTLRAKDLFRDERFDLGIFGTLSHETALDAIGRSDVVVVFGASLNEWTTAKGSLLEKKRLVHVDIERGNINRFAPSDAGLVGDAAIVADTIVDWLEEAGAKPTSFASEELARRLAEYADADHADVSTEETVDIRTAMRRIDVAFPADRNLVIDSGRFIFEAYTRLHCPEPSAYVHTVNFGSIGLGMGNAIGASLGAPRRPTLLVCGDGGFMLGGMAEFNTAVRHRLDLVVVVLNDGAYGAEHIQLRRKNKDPSITMFDWPDFALVATALGGQGHTVRTLAQLETALTAIETRDRPLLIDIRIDPEQVAMPGH